MWRVDQDLEKPPRRILLISYWYPPAIGAAAERIGAFARYLPQHGWQTDVLTAQRMGAAVELEGITVHDVNDRFAAREQLFADYDPTCEKPTGIKARLREFVFPDRFLAWQRAGLEVGKDIVRESSFDLILASFPPASVVLLALNLHRASGIRLVLDFRDRWFGPGGYQPRRAKARQAHERLLRDAVAAACAVIAVSEPMADAIAEEHHYDRDRIFVVPNGYEAEETPKSQKAKTGKNQNVEKSKSQNRAILEPQAAILNQQSQVPLTVAHVGTVIARNRPDLFFASLRALKGRECLGGVCFRFVGNLSREYIARIGLSSIVKTTGLVPRAEASREMVGADALLLLTGSYVGRWGYNAKVFEYVQTGRPILCLEESPGSNDRKLLESFAADRAFFAPVDDAEAIADQVVKLRGHVLENPHPAVELDDAFRCYSRLNLTAELAEHLDSLFPQ